MLINWSVDPILFQSGGFMIRWYGLLFASGFFAAQGIVRVLAKREGEDPEFVDSLLWHTILGTLIGARLGHCLFYEPEYYLSHPLEILKVWRGGLASHGAAIAIPLTTLLFMRKHRHLNPWWVLDRLGVAVALAGVFIRTGNLMNSEIVGKPTDGTWGFIFHHVDKIPRHPTQVYEAVGYLVIFLTLFRFAGVPWFRDGRGRLLGAFWIGIFGFRFFVEFFKENQVAFEEALPLTMGQLLSIPLVIFGIYLLKRKQAA